MRVPSAGTGIEVLARSTKTQYRLRHSGPGLCFWRRTIGLEMDGAPSGLGIRSKRYAMLVEDGVVKALHVEDTPRNAVESSAERLLADL